MAYATSNPPARVAGAIAGPSLWIYEHATDPRATVIAQDYFTDAQDLGIKIGDFVLHFETDALLGSLSTVSTVGSTGTLMVAMVLS